MLNITIEHINELLAAAQESKEAMLNDDGPEDDDYKFTRGFAGSSRLCSPLFDGLSFGIAGDHPLYRAILAMLSRGYISRQFDDPDLSAFPREVCAMHDGVRAGLVTGMLPTRPDYVIAFLTGYKAILEGKEPTVPWVGALEIEFEETQDAD